MLLPILFSGTSGKTCAFQRRRAPAFSAQLIQQPDFSRYAFVTLVLCAPRETLYRPRVLEVRSGTDRTYVYSSAPVPSVPRSSVFSCRRSAPTVVDDFDISASAPTSGL